MKGWGRPSPGSAVAMTALAFGLAGTAIAAPEAVKSVLNKQEKKQVKKIAKSQADLRISQRAGGLSVASAAVASSAATAQNAQASQTAEIAENAQTAQRAADADTVGGLQVRSFRRNYTTATDPEEVLNLAGLRILADCGDGGGGPDLVGLNARTTTNNAVITIGTENLNPNTAAVSTGFGGFADFDVGDSANLRPGNEDRTNGTLTYTSPNGSVVTVNYMAVRFPGQRCLVAGVAIGG